MAKIAIAVEGIRVRFGDNLALGSVSLALEPGELMLLLGPSGCGKSTLLRTIAGFVKPEAGRVLFDGEDVTHVPPHRRQIGMVFQSFALFPHLTVGENVAFGLREQKRPQSEIGERVERALANVKMGGFGARRVDQLSGGEQQRVALARALVTRPRCLLLDEPLSNLDAGLRHTMREEIRRVCKEHGLTTLYVTHDQKEALAIADRIAVMQKGRLEQLGTPWQVYRTPRSRSVATFLGETNLLSAEVVGKTDSELRVRLGTLELTAEPTELHSGFEVGARVLLSIRPECIRLSEARATDAAFSVRVSRSNYLGELCEHELTHGELSLRAYEINPHSPSSHPGRELWAEISPRDVVLLEAEPVA
ncbi:MAG TPA: ABC transporter ATP-binding protein [Polyangiaceae bacterium]|nr:ABC transporter ATP-binding protein [Polyangiaceae bacterium]